MTLRELHLFAGAGGGILGSILLGHQVVGAVEINRYCRSVLEARQRDGCLEPFPIHDDITTFDGSAWRGQVDVVAGGFPCQDISTAGKGAGLDGERSGLWWHMHRVIREVEPRFVFVENVAALLVRGLDRVLGSLADLGFDAEWCVLSAADCGAPHLRKRLWLLAWHPDREQQDQVGEIQAREPTDSTGAGQDSDASGKRRREGGARRVTALGQDRYAEARDGAAERSGWWATEPRVGRVANGVPSWVDRLRALGNAQVPVVAAQAWRILIARSAQVVRP